MAQKEKNNIRVSEQSPLKWPHGQERTLLDRRMAKNGWKKTFRQQVERLTKQLEKLGIVEAELTFNPAPADRTDPGVALAFAQPKKQDYSWQVGLGIDNPMPTERQINDAFRAKAMIHHPDKVKEAGGDVKLYYRYDEYRKQALAWISGKVEREYAIAVDRCTEPRWNVEAIRRILIAAATMDEYGNPGTLERTFRGFKVALPAHASSEERHGDKAVNA
jgi:hypothetical protein